MRRLITANLVGTLLLAAGPLLWTQSPASSVDPTQVDAAAQAKQSDIATRAAAFVATNGVKRFVTVSQLATNPSIYQRQVVAVCAVFEKMTSATEGLFYDSHLNDALLVFAIPTARFTEKRSMVMLAGRVLGDQTIRDRASAVPHLYFVGSAFSQKPDCGEYSIVTEESLETIREEVLAAHPSDHPLAAAVNLGAIARAEILLKGNVAKEDLAEAFHLAAMYGLTGLLELMLAKGVDINVRNADGQTALFRTLANGYANVAEMLAKRGADINARDKHGRTALMEAAYGYGPHAKEMIETLLSNGADPNLVDQDGHTSLSIAKKGSDPSLASLLSARGAK